MPRTAPTGRARARLSSRKPSSSPNDRPTVKYAANADPHGHLLEKPARTPVGWAVPRNRPGSSMPAFVVTLVVAALLLGLLQIWFTDDALAG